MAATTINVTNGTLKGAVAGPTFTGNVDGSRFTGTVTYEADTTEPPPTEPPPTEPPPMTDWNPPSYLRKDVTAETASNEPRPKYLEPYTDPLFQTKIIRITGDPGSAIKNVSGGKWGDVARHQYSSVQAWNADQSLIYLATNGGDGAAVAWDVILDGESYEPICAGNNRPSGGDARWHPKDPAVMLMAVDSKLITWNPRTGAQSILKNFGSAYSNCLFGPWEGSPSDDGNMVVISCKKDGEDAAFAYRISTDEKFPDIKASSIGSGFDNARISPKGTYMVWGVATDKVVITDLNGTKLTALADNMVSHYDVAVGPDGEEYVVGRVNSGSVNMGKAGRLARYRMKDGAGMGLNTGGWCSHTSARGGWALSAATDENGGNPPYDGELVMAALDGSACYRLGHTHEPDTVDYDAQTQPSHSPDGGRVIFASAWGGSGSEPRPVGCYVVDFRT